MSTDFEQYTFGDRVHVLTSIVWAEAIEEDLEGRSVDYGEWGEFLLGLLEETA